jgi:hypothetical protein
MGFFDFLGSLGDVLGQIASELDAIFAAMWNALYSILQFIWNTLVALGNFLIGVFQNVAKFLSRVWDDFIKPAINWILQEIAKLYAKIRSILNPILRWIQKARQWYDTHILPILQRQIRMIQKIRQFLAILRLFHVKWAQRLDDKLSGIQGKIEDTISIVRGYFNLIIDWIALICDQTSVIRRSVLGSWLLSHLGALKRIVGYGDGRPLTQDEQDAIAKAHDRYTAANVHDHLQTLSMTGLTTDDMAERDAARAGIEAAIGETLPY